MPSHQDCCWRPDKCKLPLTSETFSWVASWGQADVANRKCMQLNQNEKNWNAQNIPVKTENGVNETRTEEILRNVEISWMLKDYPFGNLQTGNRYVSMLYPAT